MESAPTREVLLFAAYATIFSLVGLVSLVAAFRWRNARRTGLFLATAMLLHGVNLSSGSAPVRIAFGGAPRLWEWVLAIGSYSIGVPWALLVEEIVGPGWKSSIRRTRQGFAVYALGATTLSTRRGSVKNVALSEKH